QLIRPLTPEEFSDLKEDIRKRGVCVPILVDDRHNILDGHHRSRIVEELQAEGVEVDLPVRTVEGLSDEDKEQLRDELNSHRRQLSPAARRNLIRKHLIEQPEKKDRQIARATGASPTTVGKVRQEHEAEKRVEEAQVTAGFEPAAPPESEDHPEPAGPVLTAKEQKALDGLDKAVSYVSAAIAGHGRMYPAEYELLRDEAEKLNRHLKFYEGFFKVDPETIEVDGSGA
ncbi:MAG: ParB N-terminal domain-containing protein, partial [Actinomycetota bacterium]|nr:ParB N-terminal domain-containing protein [Actinomycetota bacterium]